VTYSPGTVVKVPFPFVDSATSKYRPALILSSSEFNSQHDHSIMAMITSAKHSRWHSDVNISNLDSTGLSSPSVIRFKVFTLDNRLIAGEVGKLSKPDWNNVLKVLKKVMVNAK
jgi:mRNA interferase MazF